MTRPPPISPLFPYTTLFRSRTKPQAASAAAASPRRTISRRSTTPRKTTFRTRSWGSNQARRKTMCGKLFSERSEEHTSELQSHVNLVCRLLLEKKKKKIKMKEDKYIRCITENENKVR